MAHSCSRCETDLADDRHGLCYRCEGTARQALTDIRQRVALIKTAEPLGSTSNDRGNSDIHLGVNIDLLDVLAGYTVLPVLESWEAQIRRTYQLVPYGIVSSVIPAGDGPVVTRMIHTRCDFLSTWLQTIMQDDWPLLGDMVSDLTREASRLGSLSQETGITSWRVACPADTSDGDMCGKAIRIAREDLEDDKRVSCRGCGRDWTARRLVVVAASTEDIDVWVPADVLTGWYGITARTLRRWVKDGRVERRGTLYSDRRLRVPRG